MCFSACSYSFVNFPIGFPVVCTSLETLVYFAVLLVLMVAITGK